MSKRSTRPARTAAPRLVLDNGKWEVWVGGEFVEAFDSRADAVICADSLK